MNIRPARFKNLRHSPEEWAELDLVLLDGELGIEEHDNPDPDLIKTGDGVSKWSELPYTVQGDSAVTSVNGETGDVVLDAGDIGVTPTGHILETEAQAALEGIGNPTHTETDYHQPPTSAASPNNGQMHWQSGTSWHWYADLYGSGLEEGDEITLHYQATAVTCTATLGPIATVPDGFGRYVQPITTSLDWSNYVGTSGWWTNISSATVLDELLTSQDFGPGPFMGSEGNPVWHPDDNGVARATHEHAWNIYPEMGTTGYSAYPLDKGGVFEDLGIVTVDGQILWTVFMIPAWTDGERTKVASAHFISGATAMAGCSHIWACVYGYKSGGPMPLAVQSVDAPGASWAANTLKSFTFPVATEVPNAQYDGLLVVWVGLMICASQHPSLCGMRYPYISGINTEAKRGTSTGLTTTAPATENQIIYESARLWAAVRL